MTDDNTTDFSDLTAVYINCSIKKDKSKSHTQLLMDKSASIMQAEGVHVEQLYALDHPIAFGIVKLPLSRTPCLFPA